MALYQFFDFVIDSDVGLPDLPAGEGSSALRVTRNDSARDLTGFEWIHEWQGYDEAVFMACARCKEDYVLRFPGLVDFDLFFAEQTIVIRASADAEDHTINHLLLDQVIPRYVSHLGKMVLHASAVELPSGEMIAFLGESGQGKSTLSAYWHKHRGGNTADDCLMLDVRGADVVAIPAYPSFRLWDDSVAALFSPEQPLNLVSQYSSKKSFQIKSPTAHNDKRYPRLAAMFLLKDSNSLSKNGGVVISKLTGMDVVMSLTSSTFPLDPVSKNAVKRNFHSTQAVTQAHTRMYELDYPRDYETLAQVVHEIEKFLALEPSIG